MNEQLTDGWLERELARIRDPHEILRLVVAIMPNVGPFLAAYVAKLEAALAAREVTTTIMVPSGDNDQSNALAAVPPCPEQERKRVVDSARVRKQRKRESEGATTDSGNLDYPPG
jgi:hypothetical protein